MHQPALDLSWDAQYRLTAVSTNGVVVEAYGYDPFGRRAWTTTYPLPVGEGQGEGVKTLHMYVGIHCVADLDADGTVLRSYTYGPGVDNLLAITDHTTASPTTTFALTDHLGTVHALADASGAIVESYAYDAWGNVLGVWDDAGLPTPDSRVGNRFLFQGREHSWATGLTNFRARWYDPATGRWLSNDPIGISGGLNQYVFCGNDPVNYVDPMGTELKEIGGRKRAILDNMVTEVETAGNADLANKLRGKIANGEIVFDTKLGPNEVGKVTRLRKSRYIRLNEDWYPEENYGVLYDQMKNTMLHEYVHTIQFSNTPSTIFFVVIDGLSIPFYTSAEQFGIWLGGGEVDLLTAMYSNKPSEVMARRLSGKITPLPQ